MKIGIITVGDELLIGQVVNTNASWIGEQVTVAGHSVVSHRTVADSIQDIHLALGEVAGMCDAIVISGGLGPTHDDLTIEALRQYFADEYVLSEVWLTKLNALMSRLGRPLTETNASQARVPKTAVLLDNPMGTAPGILYERDGKMVFALPGVPSEMKRMLASEVLPRMPISGEDLTVYSTIHTAGIVESNLVDLVGDFTTLLPNVKVAILPGYRGVRIRLGCKGNSIEQGYEKLDLSQRVLIERIAPYYVGLNDMSVVPTIAKEIVERGLTVSVAESCTSGLLGAALTEYPGSSSWFEGGVLSYSNEVKKSMLGVTQNVLDVYGAVSEECAKMMASGVRQTLGTSMGVSVTGIAGPDGGTKDKQVGTVWIGFADEFGVSAKKFLFGKDRFVNRERSVGAALWILLQGVRNTSHVMDSSQVEKR